VLPRFDAQGNLPSGVHWVGWKEFARRFGATAHRRRLLAGLRAGLDSLRAANWRTVYVDGSFVTAKEHPNDYDACWEVADVDPALLDPVFLEFSDGRAAQKAKYLGEFFPAQLPEGVSGKAFLDFFQIDKETGNPKGIVALHLRRFRP
jgi:hypothetical protein